MRRTFRRRTSRQNNAASCDYRSIHDSEPHLFKLIRSKQYTTLRMKLANMRLKHYGGPDLLNSVCEDFNAGTALHVACWENDPEALELLLEYGLSVNIIWSKDGSTPLIAAAIEGHINIVRILLEHGADVSCKSDSSLLACPYKEQLREDSHQLPTTDLLDAYQSNTALMQACRGGHTEVVQQLLRAASPFDTQNVNGKTALHIACIGWTYHPYHTERSQFLPSVFFAPPRSKIVKLLLEHGADPGTKNHTGETPLTQLFTIRKRLLREWNFTEKEHSCILFQLFKTIQYLLQYGANFSHLNWNPAVLSCDYQESLVSSEIMVTVIFAASFHPMDKVYDVIRETLKLSVYTGCRYPAGKLKEVLDSDSGLQEKMKDLVPFLTEPRSLLEASLSFVRCYLGRIHGRLSLEIVGRLPVPRAVTCHLMLFFGHTDD